MNAAERAREALRENTLLVDHCAMLLSESKDPLPAGLLAELLRSNDEVRRPRFDDPQAYADYASDCFAKGSMPFPPEDVEQLVAIQAICPAETRFHFRHGPEALREMGLAENFYDEPMPFSERWKEGFLATVTGDDEFRRAGVAAFRGKKWA